MKTEDDCMDADNPKPAVRDQAIVIAAQSDRFDTSFGKPQLGTPTELDLLELSDCERCDGDGKAHGSDRPFEYSGPGSFPGPCPACHGSGKSR